MHANTKLIKYVNNNLILMYLSITCKLGIITFVLFFYFNKILFTYLNIINIMIFNSIEKELINYSNSPNKLSQKSTFNYKKPLNTNSNNQTAKLYNSIQFNSKTGKTGKGSAYIKQQSKLTKPAKSKSLQRLKNEMKLSHKKARKNSKNYYIKQSPTKIINFNQRCHPQTFQKCDRFQRKPLQNEYRKKISKIDECNGQEFIYSKNTNDFVVFSQNLNNQTPQINIANKKGNAFELKETKKNMFNQRLVSDRYLTPQISPSGLNSSKVESYFRSKPGQQKVKYHDHSPTKTALSAGSQLYELSPIHFNKFMEYQDKHKQKYHQYNIKGQDYFNKEPFSHYGPCSIVETQVKIEKRLIPQYQTMSQYQFSTICNKNAVTINRTSKQSKSSVQKYVQTQLQAIQPRIKDRAVQSQIIQGGSVYQNKPKQWNDELFMGQIQAQDNKQGKKQNWLQQSKGTSLLKTNTDSVITGKPIMNSAPTENQRNQELDKINNILKLEQMANIKNSCNACHCKCANLFNKEYRQRKEGGIKKQGQNKYQVTFNQKQNISHKFVAVSQDNSNYRLNKNNKTETIISGQNRSQIMSGSGNMQDNKKIQYEKAIEVKTKNTLVTQFCIYVMISCGVTLFLLQIMK